MNFFCLRENNCRVTIALSILIHLLAIFCHWQIKSRKGLVENMKKPKIGMLQAWRQCSAYQRMSNAERTILQNKRLRSIVEWSRKNSPYYARLYRDIKPDFKLSDLAPVNKVDLMAHWDDWVTDRSLTLSQVGDFMRDLDNVGRKFKGRYLVFTTSGSTGNPLVSLCDKTTNNVMGAVNAARAFARKEDMTSFIKRGGKSIGVFEPAVFILETARCVRGF